MEPPSTSLTTAEPTNAEFAQGFIADIDRRCARLRAELRDLDELRARVAAWQSRMEETHAHADAA